MQDRWRALVADQVSSGLTVKVFCETRGIETTSFYGWRKRLSSAESPGFLNRDPIDYKGGPNLYAFCDGNPVNEIDPSGNNPWKVTDPDFGVFGGHDLLQPTADFSAGWGDVLSFGLTKVGRNLAGHVAGVGDANTSVNYSSTGYKAGEAVGWCIPLRSESQVD